MLFCGAKGKATGDLFKQQELHVQSILESMKLQLAL